MAPTLRVDPLGLPPLVMYPHMPEHMVPSREGLEADCTLVIPAAGVEVAADVPAQTGLVGEHPATDVAL